MLALHADHEPSPEMPSPRVVQSELVEKDCLPEDLAMRLARVRELTEPPTGDEPVPPPSSAVGEAVLSAVRDLLELGQKHVVDAEL